MTGRKARLGMSIIEVMIGVVVLALVLIPAMSVIIGEAKTVTATRDHTQAAFLAQKILEEARSYRFALLDADQYATNPVEQQKTFEWALRNDPQKKQVNINNLLYRMIDVNIDPVKNRFAPTEIPTLVLFSFAIEYRSLDGRTHRLDVSTAITQQE